jgi:hypothetical protein
VFPPCLPLFLPPSFLSFMLGIEPRNLCKHDLCCATKPSP